MNRNFSVAAWRTGAEGSASDEAQASRGESEADAEGAE